jgi:dipeptidyl aminopeptidase/acylaminoacyl peptidase
LAAASPIHYVREDSPPLLLIHGTGDKTVDPNQSRSFDEAMRNAGAHDQLILIPDVNHSFIGATPAATQNASLEALRETFAAIDRFSKRH